MIRKTILAVPRKIATMIGLGSRDDQQVNVLRWFKFNKKVRPIHPFSIVVFVFFLFVFSILVSFIFSSSSNFEIIF